MIKNNGSTRSVAQVIHAVKSGKDLNDPWPDATDDKRLKTLVKELQFDDVSPGNQKRALRRFHLLDAIKKTPKLTGRLLLEALLLFTSHNGLLRIGELLCGLQVSDVIWDSERLGFRLHLERTKTGRSGPGVYVAFRDHGSVSAVSLMRMWFDENNLWIQHTSFIFPSTHGEILDFSRTMSQDHFRKVIKLWCITIGLDPSKFSGHSLRAGGATDLFAMRVPYYVIKKMGRWISDAALIYYRDEEDVISAVTEAFGECY